MYSQYNFLFIIVIGIAAQKGNHTIVIENICGIEFTLMALWFNVLFAFMIKIEQAAAAAATTSAITESITFFFFFLQYNIITKKPHTGVGLTPITPSSNYDFDVRESIHEILH